jgi:membrane associated rhomboid family serine protease
MSGRPQVRAVSSFGPTVPFERTPWADPTAPPPEAAAPLPAGGDGAGPGGGPSVEGVTVLGPVASRITARDHGLVLSSMQIPHEVRWIPDGWILLVRDRDYARASAAIDRYEEENRDWPPRRAKDSPRFPVSPVFAVGFLALAAFFAFLTGPVAHPHGPWLAEGRSVAAQLTSEPWRTVTALTLHADGAHVMGNVVSGTVFGTAVGRRLGPGLGALAVVASGALGNAANAAYYLATGEHHASIGASTAVFGAVGILAATQIAAFAFPSSRTLGSSAPRRWYEWAAPVLGGLGLLGALGASPSSDLGAHGFGLAAGFLVGLVAAAGLGLATRLTGARRRAPRWSAFQIASGAAAVGAVLGAWALALRA